MPSNSTRRYGAASAGKASKKKDNGMWHAPPLVNVYGYNGVEDGWYEEDYDDQACAAPVVPFGRGW